MEACKPRLCSERGCDVDVIRRLLRSRKFLVALGALVVSLGVLFWGWDDASAQVTADKIVQAVLVLAGVFMGATALEDAAKKLLGGGDKGR